MSCNQRTNIIGQVESDGSLLRCKVIVITYESLSNVFQGENMFYQKGWEHISLPLKTIDPNHCVKLEQEPIFGPHIGTQLQYVPD